MNKNLKGALVVVLVGGVVFGAYKMFFKNKISYAKYISKKTGNPYVGYMSFDEAYLKQRVIAMKKNKPTFSYNSENYDTKTGKKIV